MYGWYNIYKTSDDQAITLGAIEPHFFKNLCRLLELEDFNDKQYDADSQAAMKAAFKEKFLSNTRDFWTDLLAAENTCMAPVLSVAEVVKDEHFLARNTFMKAVHPEKGEFTQLAPVLAGCDRMQPDYHLPVKGTTNIKEVLTAAGFAEDAIQQLLDSGAVE